MLTEGVVYQVTVKLDDNMTEDQFGMKGFWPSHVLRTASLPGAQIVAQKGREYAGAH